jgi:hypothetical protein
VASKTSTAGAAETATAGAAETATAGAETATAAGAETATAAAAETATAGAALLSLPAWRRFIKVRHRTVLEMTELDEATSQPQQPGISHFHPTAYWFWKRSTGMISKCNSSLLSSDPGHEET